MCGICGIIKFKGEKVTLSDESIVKRMTDKLTHRGPDDNNTLSIENVVLGFSRLSIIGLDNGLQPLFNENNRLVLVCNGEIFNYIELKEDLIKKGHEFKSSTDVEVILHLYEEYGIDFINKLNGQFAFVLYDLNKKQIFCCRDHLGILPLYFTQIDDTFIFASEIKAILEHQLVKREVDLVGLDQVFTFAGMLSPRTMFKNINSLENGHYLEINNNGEVKNIEYWDLIFPQGTITLNGKTEDYYVYEMEKLFERAINLRLRSDVPVGLYLSGGLDSSMITMKVHHLTKDNRREAFSIDFVDSELSENPYQKLVSEASGSIFNTKTFFFDDISTRLKQAIYHCECPLKESYNTASLSLSESVRSKGIKVILSGEGADELFAGYVGFRFDKMRAMNLIDIGKNTEEDLLRDRLWGDKNFFYEKNFLEFEKTKRNLYSSQLNNSFNEINCLNNFNFNKERVANLDILNKRAYIEYKFRLVDHMVSDHGDRMAMANSVEVRYPFLDKDLVEFSTKIPPELKLKDFTEKYILKKMASKYVPSTIIDREKFHFQAPGSTYLLQKKIEYIDDILSYDRIKRQGYFNAEEIEKLKKLYTQEDFKLNTPYESDLLITVITFGILLDIFFNE